MAAHNDNSCSFQSKAIEITVYSVLMFLSLVGNSLILAVFYRNERRRTPMHYFIVNMALSDLLIPVIVPAFISEAYHNGEWLVGGVLGIILCKFVCFAVFLSTAVSMFSMVAIAVDRFYAIIFAMKPVLFSQKTCYRLIIVIWIVSLAFQAYYFFAVTLDREDDRIRCNQNLESISFFCLFAFTAFVITVSYSAIIIFLYRQKTNLHLATEAVKLRAKENRKVTSMLVIIVLAFYLLWVPLHVYYFQALDENYCVFEWVVNILPHFYTVINSSVFFIFNETFRSGCKELIRCPWFCTNKCNVCSQASVSPQDENYAPRPGQQNNRNRTIENIELQEQCQIHENIVDHKGV